ncbi:MAG: hypothetical protein ABH834_01380 [Candidatus Altiarchaeota archaeon]
MKKTHSILALAVVYFISGTAQAATLNEGLLTASAALGTLLIAVQGLRWIISESPKGRADAKKGIIWTIIGLIVAYLAINIVCGLYCHGLTTAYGGTITCGPPCV